MDGTPPGQNDGLGRIVVVNWAPDALGLVRALQQLGAPSLTLLGSLPVAEVEAALDGPRQRGMVEYRVASVGDGVEPFAEQLAGAVDRRAGQAREGVGLAAAALRQHDDRARRGDLHRACAGQPPRILVAVEDPEATHEFAGLGVSTIFYPGFLRAALLAHACLDLAVFRFMLALLHGGLRVQTWPVPDALRGKAFRDACQQVEADPDGHPVTVLGLALAGEPGMLVNPGPAQPLADAVGLLVLTGQGS